MCYAIVTWKDDKLYLKECQYFVEPSFDVTAAERHNNLYDSSFCF